MTSSCAVFRGGALQALLCLAGGRRNRQQGCWRYQEGLFCVCGQRGSLDWVAALAPGIQATLQRPNPRDAIFPQKQRHTGAGGFVWSSTVEDYFAIAGQTVILLFQFLGVHAEGAGDGFGISFEVHRMAQINNDEVFAGVEFFFQFVHGDA